MPPQQAGRGAGATPDYPIGQPDQNCWPCLLAIIDYRLLFGEVVVADLTITATDSGNIPLLQIVVSAFGS